MDNKKTRVLVVDDQSIARGYFEMYIDTSTDYELIKSLPMADAAVLFCDRHPVDLILMDIMMQYGIDGLTAAEQIKKRHPEIKIILATSMSESKWEKMAKDIGVESFWYKEYSEIPLLEIMNRTMEGESVYPETSPKPKFGQVTKAKLTNRELDVLRELTNGFSNNEIADKLGISVNTVRQHIENMLNKTGYQNRLDLAIKASFLGVVVSDESRLK
mgnify:CR=1 FL=1